MGSLLLPGTAVVVQIVLPVLVSFLLCGKVSSFAVARIVTSPTVGCTSGSTDIIRCSSFSLIPAAAAAKSTTTRLSLFGNIFGNGDDEYSDNKNENELAIHRGLVLKEKSNGKDGSNNNNNAAAADATFDSLSTYIKSWSNLFQTGSGGGKGGTIKLTTPVKVLLSDDDNDDDDNNNEGSNAAADAVVASTGVRLVFQNVDTGYKNKREEQQQQQQDEDGDQEANDGNGKREKKKPKLEGGVEILVQKIIAVDEKRNNDNNNNNQQDDDVQVQVRAKRCNFNDDTIIKEMSEETIIKELDKAISVWKRQQQKL